MTAEAQPCVFCAIVAGTLPAAIVFSDEATLAFVDLRQAHPGHTLVIPRQHVPDIRELQPDAAASLMSTLVRVTRAVDAAFPNEGLSVWHSIGPAAFQEVPHLHLHVHPRRIGDGLLRVYPELPGNIPPSSLEPTAERIRRSLEEANERPDE